MRFDRVFHWARTHKTIVASIVYALITVISLTAAYWTWADFALAVLPFRDLVLASLALLAIRLTVNTWLRIPVGRWRFVGSRDFLRLGAAQTAGSLIFFGVTRFPLFPFQVPRSIIAIEWALSGYFTMLAWVAYRISVEYFQMRQGPQARDVLVIGAGAAGEALISQMLRSPWGYRPVALLDDDPLKRGTSIHGIEVRGDTKLVNSVIAEIAVDEIVLSIPSAPASDIRRIVQECESTNRPIKILPGIGQVLDGSVTPGQLREVRIEDLLGRDPVVIPLPELVEALADDTVLVTGAAGSIGSELVRQIALNSPGRLVIFDQAETPLYYVDLELKSRFPELDLTTVVGSVTNAETLNMVMEKYRPQWVFHAAAYKHVPLMEENPSEAVRTNVLGTYLVARTAARNGCEAFVLVSTDKAVNPANIMGASKAVAEKVVLQMQELFPKCRFGAVRFGNVLGSNGSVVPLFTQQLERGDPLTVTHEDVTRYFMTIPEAVQLILQSSMLPDLRGAVAMLDMGQPVRILDLAKDMLRLSGLPYRLGENVVITGLRPGEKLHEELSGGRERSLPTKVDRVAILRPVEEDSGFPSDLETALDQGDLEQVRRFVTQALKS